MDPPKIISLPSIHPPVTELVHSLAASFNVLNWMLLENIMALHSHLHGELFFSSVSPSRTDHPHPPPGSSTTFQWVAYLPNRQTDTDKAFIHPSSTSSSFRCPFPHLFISHRIVKCPWPSSPSASVHTRSLDTSPSVDSKWVETGRGRQSQSVSQLSKSHFSQCNLFTLSKCGWTFRHRRKLTFCLVSRTISLRRSQSEQIINFKSN